MKELPSGISTADSRVQNGSRLRQSQVQEIRVCSGRGNATKKPARVTDPIPDQEHGILELIPNAERPGKAGVGVVKRLEHKDRSGAGYPTQLIWAR